MMSEFSKKLAKLHLEASINYLEIKNLVSSEECNLLAHIQAANIALSQNWKFYTRFCKGQGIAHCINMTAKNPVLGI